MVTNKATRMFLYRKCLSFLTQQSRFYLDFGGPFIFILILINRFTVHDHHSHFEVSQMKEAVRLLRLSFPFVDDPTSLPVHDKTSIMLVDSATGRNRSLFHCPPPSLTRLMYAVIDGKEELWIRKPQCSLKASRRSRSYFVVFWFIVFSKHKTNSFIFVPILLDTWT